MIVRLSLLLLSSLLALAEDAADHSDHRRHNQPDTAVDMDLKPAYVRTTRAPPHSRHSHDFSLPLPSGGAWNTHTESYDYEETESYDFTEVFTESGSHESGDYGDAPAGEKHNHHHHHHPQKDVPQEDQDSEDSFNDHLASSAVAKLPGTFLLLAGLLLILT